METELMAVTRAALIGALEKIGFEKKIGRMVHDDINALALAALASQAELQTAVRALVEALDDSLYTVEVECSPELAAVKELLP